MLEAILKEKILAHLPQFLLLTSRQHGFLPRRSTLTNLLVAECFLSRRTFHVNVNGTLFQLAETISGVPQGSVIDPILFVIYVNDLPDHLSADSLLYAEDVKLIAPRNRNDFLQNSLNSSAIWPKIQWIM